MRKIVLTDFEKGSIKLIHTAKTTDITGVRLGETVTIGSYAHVDPDKDARMEILKQVIILESDIEHALENNVISMKIPKSSDDLTLYFETRDYKINQMYGKNENKEAILNSYKDIKVAEQKKVKKPMEDTDEKNDDIEKLHRERQVILKQQMKNRINEAERNHSKKEHQKEQEKDDLEH